MVLIELCLEPRISKCSLSWIFPVSSYVLEKDCHVTLSEKKMDYLYNCKSEISSVHNVVEGHCLQAMNIMHHHANGWFDWLISEHWSVNPWKKKFLYCLGNTKDSRLSILYDCQSSFLITVISWIYKVKWWLDESMSVTFLMESTEKECCCSLSTITLYWIKLENLVMQLERQPVEAWPDEKHYSKENNTSENPIPRREISPALVKGI